MTPAELYQLYKLHADDYDTLNARMEAEVQEVRERYDPELTRLNIAHTQAWARWQASLRDEKAQLHVVPEGWQPAEDKPRPPCPGEFFIVPKKDPS